MIINLRVDVDLKESGLLENTVKDKLLDFARDLLINGAENEEIALTLKEVSYVEEERRCTGKKDIDGFLLYEGDIIESLAGGQIIEIKYGEFDAYCPADQSVMDGVGFYAVAEDYPDMPIGCTADYAKRIGNIYDNQELAVCK